MLRIWVSVILAALMWFVIFVLKPFDFWISMAFATSVLLAISLWFYPDNLSRKYWNLRSFVYGILIAIIMYGVFYAGKVLLEVIPIIPDVERFIGAVYSYPTILPRWLVGLLLLFPIGSGEEMFWRGFVQRYLMERVGRWRGFLLALVLYSGIHIPTLNPVLFLAALTAGFIWGWIYMKTENIAITTISHALWDAVVFAVFPFT